MRTAWLAATLTALDEDLDGRLTLRVGDPAEVVPAVAREITATGVHVTRETTPYGVRRDQQVQDALPGDVDWVETGTPYAGWFSYQPLWDEVVRTDPDLFD